MKNAVLAYTVLVVILGCSATVNAQETAIVFDTAFDGTGPALQDRFRRAVHDGLNTAPLFTVLTEGATRQRLGDDADRLMACGGESSCVSEAGAITGAQIGVATSVSEAGEIYTFTIDVYDLSSGDGIFFTDAECVLCTVEEALTTVTEMGEEAAASFSSGAVTALGTKLFITVSPSTADIYVNDTHVGQGYAEVEVAGGTHWLRFSADGYQTAESELPVADGDEDKEISVTLSEGEDEAPAVRGQGLLANADTTVLGSVFVGSGLVSAITGIVLIAIDGDTTCSDGDLEDCPEVFDTKTGGTVLTVMGAASLTAGVFFLLWDTLAGEPQSASTPSVGLGFSTDGLGVVLGGQF